jgi:hypothetical protein
MLKIAQRRAFAIGATAFVMLTLGVTLQASAQSPIIVAPNGKYLGNLNSNPYDPNSVSNPYGRYGSPYSSDSINNPYGIYGSPYSLQSPNNPYALGAQRRY